MITDTTLLRHLVATLAYRAAKVLRDVPAGFEEFSIEPRARVPVQILAHMGDLMGWAVRMAEGEYLWRAEGTRDWNTELRRSSMVSPRLIGFLLRVLRLAILRNC